MCVCVCLSCGVHQRVMFLGFWNRQERSSNADDPCRPGRDDRFKILELFEVQLANAQQESVRGRCVKCLLKLSPASHLHWEWVWTVLPRLHDSSRVNDDQNDR